MVESVSVERVTPYGLDAQRTKVTGDPRQARSAARGASGLTERLGSSVNSSNS